MDTSSALRLSVLRSRAACEGLIYMAFVVVEVLGLDRQEQRFSNILWPKGELKFHGTLVFIPGENNLYSGREFNPIPGYLS